MDKSLSKKEFFISITAIIVLVFVFFVVKNQETPPTPIPNPTISNPEYLANPTAFLVDYDNRSLSRIPSNKAVWVEEIKNSITLRVSYSIMKAEQNIIVLHDLQIPGLSTDIFRGSVNKGKGQCREKEAIDFLSANLLHTEVYLVFEGREKEQEDSTTWRLFMPQANRKDTADVAFYIIWNGYGKAPFWRLYSGKSEGSFFLYPYSLKEEAENILYKRSSPFSDLTDAQTVASLAKRGFWGVCQ